MATSARRGHGEGSIYPDAVNGTWAGATSLGWTLDGKRIRLAARALWQDTGLVFTTSVGTPLDASHVRRDFRALRPVITTGADVMDKIFI